MQVKPYFHKAQYYETDGMGIIHHSNYIRWFEEARIDLMEQIGYGYARMEAEGLGSPVIGVEAAYKRPVLFGATVKVCVKVEEFTGSRMTISYAITDESGGVLHCEGKTRHCFALATGRPVNLKKANPTAYTLFMGLLEETEA